MFKNLNIRTIGAPRKISFPNRRRVFVEKYDNDDKNFNLTCEDIFRPGNDLYVLKLNTLEIESYTISNFRTNSFTSKAQSRFSIESKVYFYDKKGNENDISIRMEYFSLPIIARLKEEISLSEAGKGRIFYSLNDCLKYLLEIGIPKIIKDSERYFTKKDRNLSHDKFEYKKLFYKKAKSAKKELEKYFKNNP